MLTSFGRILKFGWQHFHRHGALSVATVFILVLTICLVTSLFMLQHVTGFLISGLQEKIDVSVYFKESASEEDIFYVRDEISSFDGVERVSYVSREEALARFTERHSDNSVIMESLEEVGTNPLLASLAIKANQAAQYERVANFLQTGPFQDLIEDVNYYQNHTLIDKLFGLTASINAGGMIFSLVLAIIGVLVTFNTIRLAIHHYRGEVSVMRLVGAPNEFIRGPFIVQGFIVGICATLISIIITALLLFFFNPQMMSAVPGLNLWGYFVSNLGWVLLIQLATGVVLGAVSSVIAVRKYLEV